MSYAPFSSVPATSSRRLPTGSARRAGIVAHPHIEVCAILCAFGVVDPANGGRCVFAGNRQEAACSLRKPQESGVVRDDFESGAFACFATPACDLTVSGAGFRVTKCKHRSPLVDLPLSPWPLAASLLGLDPRPNLAVPGTGCPCIRGAPGVDEQQKGGRELMPNHPPVFVPGFGMS